MKSHNVPLHRQQSCSPWGRGIGCCEPIVTCAVPLVIIICIAATMASECPDCDAHPSNRAALDEFFSVTTGWVTSWNIANRSESLCNRFGVSCGKGGSLQIVLKKNSIRGALPHSLSLLHRVASFDVSSNELYGTLPEVFSAWGASLQLFSVSSNTLRGTLPPAYRNWTRLEKFLCEDNALHGTLPAVFSEWGHTLVEFHTGSNNLTGTLPHDYIQWTNVRTFIVAENKLTGTLPSVYGVWGSSLEAFSLMDNQFSGTLPVVYRNWTRLRHFKVGGNSKIVGTLPPEFSEWGRTAWNFGVQGCSISGTLPVSYRNWTGLTTFNVKTNVLSGTLPPEYMEWGPNFAELYVSLNQLTGSLPSSYAAWPNVSVIYAFGNLLTGSIPASWGKSNMVKLRELVLHNNNLSGTLSDTFGELPDLRALTVAANPHLGGTLPRAWGAHWQQRRGDNSFGLLRILLLQNTSLSGTIPSTWSKAGFVMFPIPTIVSLCGTQLCGPAPAAFAAAVPSVRCIPPAILAASTGTSDALLDWLMSMLSQPEIPLSDSLMQSCPSSSPPPPGGSASSDSSIYQSPRVLTNVAGIPPVAVIPLVALGSSVASVSAIGVPVALAFGIQRSAGILRLLAQCSAFQDDGADSSSSRNPRPEDDGNDAVHAYVLGHLVAFAVVVTLTFGFVGHFALFRAYSTSQERRTTGRRPLSRRLRGALVALRLPDRAGFALLPLGPALVEFGFEDVILNPNALGAAAVICGLAVLVMVTAAVTAVGLQGIVMFVRSSKREAGGLSEKMRKSIVARAAQSYETTRSGEWLASRGNQDGKDFLRMFDSFFSDYTGGRQWYPAVQCAVLLGTCIATAAGIASRDDSACVAAQIAVSVLQAGCFALLLLLRPQRRAAAFGLEAFIESFGCMGALALCGIAAADPDGSTEVAEVFFTIQFWLGMVASLGQLVHAVWLKLRSVCGGEQPPTRVDAPPPNQRRRGKKEREHSPHQCLDERSSAVSAGGLLAQDDTVASRQLDRSVQLQRLVNMICSKRRRERRGPTQGEFIVS